MHRMLALTFLLLSSLVGSALTAPVASAQDEERDLREATFTAQEILRLAFERKFNAMYDRIHPDAHAVVPRVAAVGVFEAVYADTNAGEATAHDARITSYTWPVTGKTYRNAVEVFFEQPYTDANGEQKVLRDKMPLVKDGEWRWFFGSSKEFVEQAIATYGGATAEEPLVEGDLVLDVGTDLDAFYADVLSYTDWAYEQPGFVVVGAGEGVQTGCGPAESGFLAFYCPGDATIYVDDPFIDRLQDSADFAAAFVIAHEWSHHVQTLVGFERVQGPREWNEVWSIELELMADCMSGAWALDADTRGLLETDDIDETARFTIEELGDPAFIDEYDPQAHGSAEQRVNSFLTGYEDGFSGCNIVI